LLLQMTARPTWALLHRSIYLRRGPEMNTVRPDDKTTPFASHGCSTGLVVSCDSDECLASMI
jgi:hypothetical protein